jgi:hypothetical protein
MAAVLSSCESWRHKFGTACENAFAFQSFVETGDSVVSSDLTPPCAHSLTLVRSIAVCHLSDANQHYFDRSWGQRPDSGEFDSCTASRDHSGRVSHHH